MRKEGYNASDLRIEQVEDEMATSRDDDSMLTKMMRSQRRYLFENELVSAVPMKVIKIKNNTAVAEFGSL